MGDVGRPLSLVILRVTPYNILYISGGTLNYSVQILKSPTLSKDGQRWLWQYLSQ